MVVKEIKNRIYFVGAIDWDRRIFDELIPLPEGTSYNSYLILGSKKNALIDSVDPSKEKELLQNLKSFNISVDYIISHHAEQDHSGAIPKLLEIYPDAKVVTNTLSKNMLKDLLNIPEEKFLVVKDGETLSLGNKTLKFILTPWVHWPETMVTYLIEDKILFSCDFFGSHLATSDLYASLDENKTYTAAKRYYAEIMMPFRQNIKGNIEKIKNLKIDIIAPSHGPIYDKPNFILDAYKDWISDNVKPEVLVMYVSMHGSTKEMVRYLTNSLINKGIKVNFFNLTKTDLGELAISLVDASTIIIGSPTVLNGAHPNVIYATYVANALKPKARFAGFVGSYGWGGGAFEQIKGIIRNLKLELIEPVLIKGYPKKEDFEKLEKLATEIAERNKKLG